MSADHTGCTPGVCRATDHYRAVTCGGGGDVEAPRFMCQTHMCGACGGCKAANVRDLLSEVTAERDRLKRGAAELGKSLMFWMNLAVEVTGSEDCIEEDGDGDWGVVAERLAALKPAAQPAAPQPTEGGALTEDERESLDAILVALWQSVTESGYEHMRLKVEAHVERILAARSQRPEAVADRHRDALADTADAYHAFHGWVLNCLWCEFESVGKTKAEALRGMQRHYDAVLPEGATIHA